MFNSADPSAFNQVMNQQNCSLSMPIHQNQQQPHINLQTQPVGYMGPWIGSKPALENNGDHFRAPFIDSSGFVLPQQVNMSSNSLLPREEAVDDGVSGVYTDASSVFGAPVQSNSSEGLYGEIMNTDVKKSYSNAYRAYYQPDIVEKVIELTLAS